MSSRRNGSAVTQTTVATIAANGRKGASAVVEEDDPVLLHAALTTPNRTLISATSTSKYVKVVTDTPRFLVFDTSVPTFSRIQFNQKALAGLGTLAEYQQARLAEKSNAAATSSSADALVDECAEDATGATPMDALPPKHSVAFSAVGMPKGFKELYAANNTATTTNSGTPTTTATPLLAIGKAAGNNTTTTPVAAVISSPLTASPPTTVTLSSPTAILKWSSSAFPTVTTNATTASSLSTDPISPQINATSSATVPRRRVMGQSSPTSPQLQPIVGLSFSHFCELRVITDAHHPARGQYGIFAKRNIPPQTILTPYAGTIQYCNLNPSSRCYVMSHAHTMTMEIDGEFVGNFARFANDPRGVPVYGHVAGVVGAGVGAHSTVSYTLSGNGNGEGGDEHTSGDQPQLQQTPININTPFTCGGAGAGASIILGAKTVHNVEAKVMTSRFGELFTALVTTGRHIYKGQEVLLDYGKGHRLRSQRWTSYGDEVPLTRPRETSCFPAPLLPVPYPPPLRKRKQQMLSCPQVESAVNNGEVTNVAMNDDQASAAAEVVGEKRPREEVEDPRQPMDDNEEAIPAHAGEEENGLSSSTASHQAASPKIVVSPPPPPPPTTPPPEAGMRLFWQCAHCGHHSHTSPYPTYVLLCDRCEAPRAANVRLAIAYTPSSSDSGGGNNGGNKSAGKVAAAADPKEAPLAYTGANTHASSLLKKGNVGVAPIDPEEFNFLSPPTPTVVSSKRNRHDSRSSCDPLLRQQQHADPLPYNMHHWGHDQPARDGFVSQHVLLDAARFGVTSVPAPFPLNFTFTPWHIYDSRVAIADVKRGVIAQQSDVQVQEVTEVVVEAVVVTGTSAAGGVVGEDGTVPITDGSGGVVVELDADDQRLPPSASHAGKKEVVKVEEDNKKAGSNNTPSTAVWQSANARTSLVRYNPTNYSKLSNHLSTTADTTPTHVLTTTITRMGIAAGVRADMRAWNVGEEIGVVGGQLFFASDSRVANRRKQPTHPSQSSTTTNPHVGTGVMGGIVVQSASFFCIPLPHTMTRRQVEGRTTTAETADGEAMVLFPHNEFAHIAVVPSTTRLARNQKTGGDNTPSSSNLPPPHAYNAAFTADPNAKPNVTFVTSMDHLGCVFVAAVALQKLSHTMELLVSEDDVMMLY